MDSYESLHESPHALAMGAGEFVGKRLVGSCWDGVPRTRGIWVIYPCWLLLAWLERGGYKRLPAGAWLGGST